MRATYAGLLAGLQLVVAGHAYSQSSDSVITISMQRTARLPADRVIAYVSVDATAETAVQAVARLDGVTKAVLQALARPRDVVIGPPVMVSVGDNPALRGYPPGQVPTTRTARASIKLTAGRADALIQAAALAIDAGARAVSGLTVESSHADSGRVALVREAVAASREEATVVARELGGRLGPLLGFGTTSGPVFPQQAMVTFDGGYGGNMPLSEVAVTLNVNVRYRLLR